MSKILFETLGIATFFLQRLTVSPELHIKSGLDLYKASFLRHGHKTLFNR